MGSKILEIRNLVKKYPSSFLLKINELYLEENKILTLIGPNGSGKSTFIRLINLIEEPDSGAIIFDGKSILEKGINKVEVRKSMSVVFQEPLLFSTSVYKNIIMGLDIRKIKVSFKKELFNFLVKKLKLEKLLLRNPKSLSGGEQQRVALARALIVEPKLLLLDEPFANMDPVTREELRNDMLDIFKNIRRSTIYVTHDRNEAMIIGDDVAVINNGRVEQFGKKDEVFRKPANEFIAKFVGVETLIEGYVLESKNNVCRVIVNKQESLNKRYNNNFKYNLNNNRDDNIINVYGSRLAQNIELFVVSDFKPGDKVIVAIRPEDVILYNSRTPFGMSSAMNSIKGIITDIQDIGIFKKVEIDCGFKLVSFVTQNSIERLSLDVGKGITASIKASSIHLFKK